MTRRDWALQRWLAKEVLGKDIGRKPARKPRRCKPVRNYKYKAWIRTLPSAVSGLEGCEAAHTGDDGGMGMKASDTTCIPLTPVEHREYHQIGKPAFEEKYGIVCADLVRRLNSVWKLGKEQAA